MRLATTSQMHQLEGLMAEKYHVSEELLMEAAGLQSAREIYTSYLPEIHRAPLAVVVGPGNNGADGLVVARHLSSFGVLAIEIFLCAPVAQRSVLFRKQLERCEALGLKLYDLSKELSDVIELRRFGVVVDAVFGTGLSKAPEGIFLKTIQAINGCPGQIVSLDVPSGLSSDTGHRLQAAVRASLTLTFGIAKPGLYTDDGPEQAGKIRVLPAGFARSAMRIADSHFLFNARLARRYLPKKNAKIHKAKNGHLLVAAGSAGMWGAASLVLRAASRMGVGYTSLGAHNIAEASQYLGRDLGDEVLVKPRDGSEALEKATAVVVGPGAGNDSEMPSFLQKLALTKLPVLVDADGLNALESIKPLPKHWLLTPHSKELARLLGTTPEKIEADRFGSLLEASRKFGCHVLLKGFRTLITDGTGRVLIVGSGNYGLAKAGAGDVLSGFIGSLLAQGVTTLQAAATGAYLHGRLADEWNKSGKDSRALVPSDLIENLPSLLSKLGRE